MGVESFGQVFDGGEDGVEGGGKQSNYTLIFELCTVYTIDRDDFNLQVVRLCTCESGEDALYHHQIVHELVLTSSIVYQEGFFFF